MPVLPVVVAVLSSLWKTPYHGDHIKMKLYRLIIQGRSVEASRSRRQAFAAHALDGNGIVPRSRVERVLSVVHCACALRHPAGRHLFGQLAATLLVVLWCNFYSADANTATTPLNSEPIELHCTEYPVILFSPPPSG